MTLHGEQVWLWLEPDTVALIMPVLLAEQATALLHQRRCAPSVLFHPDMPEHRVLLAGERYGVALPWPPGCTEPPTPSRFLPDDPPRPDHLGAPTRGGSTPPVPGDRPN